MTPDQLRSVMPHAGARADLFAQSIDDAMTEFGITNSRRIAAFLAQVAEESGELRWTREQASGEAYEGRAELGNTHPGDGVLTRGGGLLMLTGRFNWERCGLALNLPLIANPSLVDLPGPAARTAGWIWQTHGLNELADADKFFSITHKINGGYNGGDQRLGYFLGFRKLLSL